MTPAAQARLASLADGIVRLGPRTVHLDVTNACNARCITCWDHSPHLLRPHPAEWRSRMLEPAFVRRLLDELAALGGLEEVIVSGMGDPLVHPHIDEILAAIKQRRLRLTVLSNLLAADVERVLALGVDQILIGIHAASPETYRAFHPGWGRQEWDRLMHALARCHQAGRRCKHVHVICAVNAHELVGMIELGARFGAEQVSYKLAALAGGTERVRLGEAARRWLLAEGIGLAEATASRHGVRHNLDLLRTQLAAGGEATAEMAEVGCWLGYDYARITVDGDVLFCCSPEVKVGNALAPGAFTRLWQGPAWQELRARVARGELFPACNRCGKLNQNVKLAGRFRARFAARWTGAAVEGGGVR